MSTRTQQIEDAVYARAVEAVRKEGRCSIAVIQVGARVSYDGALAFIDRMVKEGVVGPLNEDGQREVLPAA